MTIYFSVLSSFFGPQAQKDCELLIYHTLWDTALQIHSLIVNSFSHLTWKYFFLLQFVLKSTVFVLKVLPFWDQLGLNNRLNFVSYFIRRFSFAYWRSFLCHFQRKVFSNCNQLLNYGSGIKYMANIDENQGSISPSLKAQKLLHKKTFTQSIFAAYFGTQIRKQI